MSDHKIKETDLLYLINDVDFERVDLGLKSVNIFEVLEISRTEIRHSNFLGWLLNPSENHGLNELVLVRFLRTVFSDERAKDLNSLDADQLDYRMVDIRREWQAIDLLIIVENVVVCIENKFDSSEHSNQLKRYHKVIHEQFPEFKKVFVFLTPNAQSSKDDGEVYIEYSYQQFVDILERMLFVYGDTLNEKIHHYLKDYIQILKRTVMQSDKLNELAVKLYQNHRATLDFIFENRPDVEQEVRSLFQKKIEETGWVLGSIHKGYARFLTPALDNVIPRYDFSNGWPKKEAFLFEIDFFWYKRDLVFKTVISPGAEEIAKGLQQAISRVDGSSKPAGQKWICQFIVKEKFDMDKISELTEDERYARINKIWPAIEEVVMKVEKAILQDEQLLETLKNYNE